MRTLFLGISIFGQPRSVDFTDTCWPGPLSIHGPLKTHKEHRTGLAVINVSLTISDVLLNFEAWAAEYTTTKSVITGTSVEGVRTLVGINEDGQPGVAARVMGIIACDELNDQSPGSGAWVIGKRRGVELKLKMYGEIYLTFVSVKTYGRTALVVAIRVFCLVFVSSCCKWTAISLLRYSKQVGHWNKQRLDC